MGYRGTVNTLLNFGEGRFTPGGEPGAVGHLVGEPHRGLTSMFHMMNEARVGVGAGAAALGYTGYLHALDYARTRTQGRPVGAKDPLAPPVPIVRHPDVARGYTREYAVEQFYRDNRLNPIHEGTHGVQGLDLLGRKVTLDGGAGLRLLLERMAGTAGRARAAGGEPAEHGGALAAAVARIAEVTAALWGAGDPAVTLANSSLYLEAVGHVVVAWIWLEQVLAAAGREDDLAAGKRAAARFFFRHELPRTAPRFDLLASLDRTTLDVRDAWF